MKTTLKSISAALLVSLVGCVPVSCIAQAKTEIQVNRGHMDDKGLPEPARLIATDAVDAWSQQLYRLIGKKMSADVVARMKARGDLPEGYEE